jgi:hypothetical protein
MYHDVQILYSEDDNPHGVFLWPFLNQSRKMTLDVKNKQRSVIEFLLLKGCSGKEIVIRL